MFDASAFRSRVAAECDFDPTEQGLGPADVVRMDRYVQFAVVAAREAVADSEVELSTADPTRVGVTMGTAVGGTTRLERDYVAVSDGGRKWLVDHRYASPFLYEALVPEQPGERDRCRVRRPGPGDGRFHRLHVRASTPSAPGRRWWRGATPTS